MLKVYGIKNCDTVRKARKWLDGHDLPYEFHDFREQGINEADISDWLQQIPADQLLNRRSTTWKQLSESEKQRTDNEQLPKLLAEYPTLIKRPVFVADDLVETGFSEKTSHPLLQKLQDHR